MNRLHYLLALLVALAAPVARAADIAWGNSLFDPLKMYDSTGNLLNNSFSFELGTWATGFTPDASNVSQWSSNWKMISAAGASIPNSWVSLDASDPNVNDPNQNFQWFEHSASFNSNGTVVGGGPSIFATGQQAYLWVFNTKSVSPTTEWALVTDLSPGTTGDDIWRLPDPTDTLPSSSYYWNLEGADTAVFGSVNGVSGAGTQVTNPGADRLQTFNLSAVPEPGSALMVLLAGVLLRLRRTQRRA